MILAFLPGAAPPTPDEARRLLGEELARPEYATTWWGRLRRWLEDVLSTATGAGDLTPALAVGAGILLVVVALVAWRTVAARRRARRPVPEPDGVLAEPGTTAEDYRARARTHLDAGHPREALLDAFRALAAHADETGAAPASPGRTAGSLARALGRHRPDLDADLAGCAAAFDAVRYGDADASPADVAAVLAVGDRLAGPPATAGAGDADGAALAPPGGVR